jgi:tricorn protease
MPLDDSPADWMEGRDVQLQAAVDYILAEMKKHPASLPAPPPALPAYPKAAGGGQ